MSKISFRRIDRRRMMNILIVDDNEFLLNALSMWLHRQMPGNRILIGFNGKDGMEILKQNPVDLIMTDLQMPVMDGFRFIEQKNGVCPDTPVIAMTSDRSEDVLSRLKALGVTRCLEKPFEFISLSGKLMEAVHADQSRCEPVTA